MDHLPDCRCLICYREGNFTDFAPKSAGAGCQLECPECLNNDGDYIEKIPARELVEV